MGSMDLEARKTFTLVYTIIGFHFSFYIQEISCYLEVTFSGTSVFYLQVFKKNKTASKSTQHIFFYVNFCYLKKKKAVLHLFLNFRIVKHPLSCA